ncbi:proline-rich protein 4 [Quercus suber]|uniref:Proline-rich protein 4 n=1 Tax=Quercus suber TaxID=58331 RepID=A0AAW0JLZ2_QUESU
MISKQFVSPAKRNGVFASEFDFLGGFFVQRKVALPCGVCREKGFYKCKLCNGNATIEWSPMYDPVAINPCLCPTYEGNSNNNFVYNGAGLRVTIDCKPENGHFKIRGVGKLDEEGKFKVFVRCKIVKDGKLNEECSAQLHSVSAAPCLAHNGLESSKVVFKSKAKGKYTFGLVGKLKFSHVTCTSAFLWPHYKYPPLIKKQEVECIVKQ